MNQNSKVQYSLKIKAIKSKLNDQSTTLMYTSFNEKNL